LIRKVKETQYFHQSECPPYQGESMREKEDITYYQHAQVKGNGFGSKVFGEVI